MNTSSIKRKDQAFWASCMPPRQSEISPFFWNGGHEWQHLELQNLFTIGIQTTFRLSFQNSLKKTKYYCNISVGLINRPAKNTGSPGRFDLKFFRNCPIRIEIITGSHIFILFLPRVVTLCLHFTPRYRLW
jgi:hypothetical protein